MTLAPYLKAIAEFHAKYEIDENVGSELPYRLCLMIEELGEIAACVTKGASHNDLAEEHADLFILLLGNCLVAKIDLEKAFWTKVDRIMQRASVATPLGPRVTDTPRGQEK